MGVFNALAIFFKVSIVGLFCFPASRLIIVLLETSQVATVSLGKSFFHFSLSAPALPEKMTLGFQQADKKEEA